ncbi:MAG: DUF2231 domain-containing protein [Blastocatellia bacterium]
MNFKEEITASHASIGGHPIHPILVAFPIGLWVFSLVSDIVYFMGWGSAIWNDVAFYSMAGGIVGALLAAAPWIPAQPVSCPPDLDQEAQIGQINRPQAVGLDEDLPPQNVLLRPRACRGRCNFQASFRKCG